MNIRKYRLSRAAEAELLELWAYIMEQSQSEQRADKVVGNIVLKFTTLADFPHMGRSRDELGIGYRSFPVDRYVVYYRLVSDSIEISHYCMVRKMCLRCSSLCRKRKIPRNQSSESGNWTTTLAPP